MTVALISGITGFIGQELAQQLTQVGIEVHGLTRKSVSPLSGTAVRLHQIDGTTETIIAALNTVKPQYVVHLAGIARREHLSSDILPFIQTNITLGVQLLQGMRLSGCRHFVTAGSYLQYSDMGEARPLNLYAATKNAFNRVLQHAVHAFGISAAELVLGNIYGENDPRPQLITDIATALTERRPLMLHGEEAWIDPIHVEDAAAAFVRALQIVGDYPADAGRLLRYSVTCGRDISASELLLIFESAGNQKIEVHRNQFALGSTRKTKPYRGEVVPGWTPQVPIEVGARRLLCSKLQRRELQANARG